jgi:endonuclease-3
MAPESAAARKARALRIVRRARAAYPDARCALRHRNAFELLIATILSAQCTDAKVNEVTATLFERFPGPRELAAADASEVEAIVRPTGFFRQKTKSLIAASQGLVERFGGRVPRSLEELTSLRGVARKTANVVLGVAFGVPGLAIDTHMARIHQRLGLTRAEDPDAIERDLMQLIPRPQWTDHTLRMIHHGRVCCQARAPRCELCPLRPDCPWPASRAARPARSRMARARA